MFDPRAENIRSAVAVNDLVMGQHADDIGVAWVPASNRLTLSTTMHPATSYGGQIASSARKRRGRDNHNGLRRERSASGRVGFPR
jgi:hypothetical protein